jgi:sugar phosphate isomerase/epimerase
MKIAMSSACLWGADIFEIIRFAYDAGFDGVELWTEQLGRRPETAAIRRLANGLGISLSAHAASWDLNLCSHNAVIRAASLSEIKRSIAMAAELGAESITVHPGRIGSPVFGEDFYRRRMAESLAEICRCGAEADTAVSLELMEKIIREFVTTPAVISAILDEVSPLSCGVTLDIAHLDSAEMFFEYFAALYLAGPRRVDKIHLSNRRGNRYHTPVFQGDIAMTGILETLEAHNLPVVIEGSAVSREELTWTLERIRQLAGQKVA